MRCSSATPALRGEIEEAPGTGIDPAILLGHVAARTTDLGVIITASSTYNSPYNLARRFQALDIVTKGRVGVNIVTTGTPAAAANFGLAEHPDKSTRYRRAGEFLDVVTKLWDSWQPGWLVADKATGRYADLDKIQPIDHHGEFFDVAGPLPVPAGPQGRPVIVQAGGSEGGLQLAGDFADVVFTVAQTQGKAVAFRDDIRRRAVAAGRRADDVLVSLGVVVVVGLDAAEAQERAQALYATLPIERLTQDCSSTRATGRPVRSRRRDHRHRPAAEHPRARVLRRLRDLHSCPARGTAVHATRARPAQCRRWGHRLVVGSPEQIADDLADWYAAGA